MSNIFIQKNVKIRDGISTGTSVFMPTPKEMPIFLEFEESSEEVQKIIMQLPTKWCSLDPIPTWLLKECLDLRLPLVTKIVNLSMSSGEIPLNLKEAIILPLIKKALLDPEILNLIHPVPNLSFLSKLV